MAKHLIKFISDLDIKNISKYGGSMAMKEIVYFLSFLGFNILDFLRTYVQELDIVYSCDSYLMYIDYYIAKTIEDLYNYVNLKGKESVENIINLLR